MRIIATLGFMLLFVGCGKDIDPRFATPESTVNTLFATYGLDAASEEEVARVLSSGKSPKLRDEDGYRECFSDWTQPAHEGGAGFVVGRLLVRKESLQYEQGGVTTKVIVPGAEDPVVLINVDGEWKISLTKSVPTQVQRQLVTLYHRADAERRRAGRTN